MPGAPGRAWTVRAVTTFCLWIFILTALPVAGIKWLALSRLASLATIGDEDTSACERLTGLINRQVQICKRNVEVMNSVRSGALRCIDECQHQFQSRRWNCSTLREGRLFGSALTGGTRESAFVHALSAAGVAHEVTRACSSGELGRCGCDRTVRGNAPDESFQWSGCSDNVLFGTAFSRAFVDARELRASRGRSGSPRSLMNLHNNEAGRKALENNMKTECKCHGVSGSCEMKTCWRAMPSFRKVGEILKEKFDGATQVQLRKAGSRRELVPTSPHFKPHTEVDLIYLDTSPDFCEFDERLGSLGTQGRRCNHTSRAIDGCDLLCCGRGSNGQRERVIERCKCKFYWCCYVKCKDCVRDVEVHTCL